VNEHPETDPQKLRNMAAIIITVSGAGQSLSLWLLPVTPGLLMTALLGSLYLLLGLGLFGTARLSLLLAIVLPPLRSWFGLYPLDIDAWELLRIAGDLAIAALCIPALWSSLDPMHHRAAPETAGAMTEDSPGKSIGNSPDESSNA
jgi:hypothetical protein